jgi:hypothetical protein
VIAKILTILLVEVRKTGELLYQQQGGSWEPNICPAGRQDARRFGTGRPGKDGWRFPAAGEKIWKKILHSPDIEGRLMFKISKIGLFSHIRYAIIVYATQ